MTKKERLNAIKNHLGFTKNIDFARYLGIKPTTLSMWYKRNTFDIELLFKKCDFLNPEWLLTGKGPMLRKHIKTVGTGGELVKLAKEKAPAPSTELQEIPVYDIRASAGLGMIFSDQSRQIPIEYLRIPYLPKADGALFVTGDSMYPLLKAGDIVIFRRVNNIPDGFIWGEIYLLDINLNGDEFVSIKYVQKSEKGDEYIKLVSHNEHHHSKDIPVSSVRTAAHILASIRFNTML